MPLLRKLFKNFPFYGYIFNISSGNCPVLLLELRSCWILMKNLYGISLKSLQRIYQIFCELILQFLFIFQTNYSWSEIVLFLRISLKIPLELPSKLFWAFHRQFLLKLSRQFLRFYRDFIWKWKLRQSFQDSFVNSFRNSFGHFYAKSFENSFGNYFSNSVKSCLWKKSQR